MRRSLVLLLAMLTPGCLIARVSLEGAEPIDAAIPVEVGQDAHRVDAFEEDAAVAMDDAFIAPRDDAFVIQEDAFSAPDADSDAPTCIPAPESCNGRDEDCDGIPDDGACRWGGVTCTAFVHDGRVYQYCQVPLTRDVAFDVCLGFSGYTLVGIASMEEGEAVRINTREAIWTQLRRSSGVFRFEDGSAATYLPWSAGEPNDTGGMEDCVEAYTNGLWNDARCFRTRHFVCERPIAF